MFPSLPTSFILIRDLKITANWSQEDKENITQAVSFGPFDIRKGTLNQNSLVVKDLQAICWISQLMPALHQQQVKCYKPRLVYKCKKHPIGCSFYCKLKCLEFKSNGHNCVTPAACLLGKGVRFIV